MLPGNGTLDIFAKSLQNYKGDRRVILYYTTTPGNADEIESVVEQCVAKSNFVAFSYYCDHESMGGQYRGDFAGVRSEVDRMIGRFPNRIITSSYINEVATTNVMVGKRWGYDVCCTISPDNAVNQARVRNGNPYNSHFRAFNADLKTMRRCCISVNNDCNDCYNVYPRMSWIMANLELHLSSKADFMG